MSIIQANEVRPLDRVLTEGSQVQQVTAVAVEDERVRLTYGEHGEDVLGLHGPVALHQRVLTDTVLALVSQFQESTGAVMGDSGDAYGRGWERWQKRGDLYNAAAQAMSAPSVRLMNDSPLVSSVQHLARILDFEAEADAFMVEWIAKDDEEVGAQPWLVSAERFALWLNTGEPEHPDSENVLKATYYGPENLGTFNTYNYENVLDETLQGVEFTYDGEAHAGEENGFIAGERYVLLQTHNGCDARAGYSRPRVYRYSDADVQLTDADIDAYHEVPVPQKEVLELAGLPEIPPFHAFTYRHGEWSDFDGDYLSADEAPRLVETEDGEEYLACPVCAARLSLGLIG